jgi:hypothetical protein
LTSGEKARENRQKISFISTCGRNHKTIRRNPKNYKYWSNRINFLKSWSIKFQINRKKLVTKSRTPSKNFSSLLKTSQPNYQFPTATSKISSTTSESRPFTSKHTTSAKTSSTSARESQILTPLRSSRAQWTPLKYYNSLQPYSPSFWATISKKKISRKWCKELRSISKW